MKSYRKAFIKTHNQHFIVTLQNIQTNNNISNGQVSRQQILPVTYIYMTIVMNVN